MEPRDEENQTNDLRQATETALAWAEIEATSQAIADEIAERVDDGSEEE